MARLIHKRIAEPELRILPGLHHPTLLEAPELVGSRLRAFPRQQVIELRSALNALVARHLPAPWVLYWT